MRMTEMARAVLGAIASALLSASTAAALTGPAPGVEPAPGGPCFLRNCDNKDSYNACTRCCESNCSGTNCDTHCWNKHCKGRNPMPAGCPAEAST